MPSTLFSSTAVDAVPLLPRYKCRVCGIFKANAHFSNKELKDFQFRKHKNSRLNDVSARLRCRPCSGTQAFELECQGPCGIIKELSKFSKSSRTRGNQWCIDCTLWKEAATPLVETPAAPGQELAPDEIWSASTSDLTGLEDDDDDDSDDDFDYYDTVTIAASTTQSIGAGPSTISRSMAMPYQALATLHLRDDISSSHERPPLSISNYTPPHLRGASENLPPQDTGKGSQSSVSNPYEVSDSVNVTTSGWKEVDTKRRGGIPYTSYGPNGEVVQRISSTPSSSYGLSASKPTNTWARAVGTRNPAPKAPTPSRFTQNNNYVGDESEDEP